jgi:hypothetical protein
LLFRDVKVCAAFVHVGLFCNCGHKFV